jgi:integrase
VADGGGVVSRRKQRTAGAWEMRVREYLDFRSRLGFTLRSTGEELLLFARHLDAIRHRGPLTVADAIDWAKLSTDAQPQYWAWRLQAVRGFAKHLAATDARHEVPLSGAIGSTYNRRTPHVYTGAEVEALLEITNIIRPIGGLPAHTFRAFFGLLAATGMRCGEGLCLGRDDVDMTVGRLIIRKAKLGKTRELPLHQSTVDALSAYVARRDATFRRARRSDSFFVSRRGTPLSYQRVTVTFRHLRRQLGWSGAPLPRLHDLRHTFAVRNLLRWCRAGDDVDKKIVSLTAYMGHVHVTSTYWYLTAVPELMAIWAARFESFVRSGGGR